MAKKTPPERSREYRELKASIQDDLTAAGKVSQIYQDMADSYMRLWVDLKNFEADIAERGVVVLDEKRGQLVENRSVSLKLQVLREMRAIYADLTRDDGKGNRAGDDDEL